jgi:hypothetical protein
MKGSLVLLAAMALCLMSTASAQPIVNVLPQTINAELGDVFTVCITVDPMGDEIYAAQYDLYFDNSILSATAQTQGVFLSIGGDTFVTKNEINNTIGKIMYGETILTAENGVTTPGILTSITFRVVGDGTCNLDLEDVVLSDPDLEEIDGVIANDGICIVKNVTTMLVEPSHQDVSYGDVFTVNITVDPKGEPVYAAQYKLLFDAAMLDVISQTPEGFLSQDGSSTDVQWNTLDNTTGETTYKETRIGDVGGVTSRGTLASITFEVIGCSGTGSLNLNDVVILNSTDSIEPILAHNATYTLSSSVSAYSMSIMSTEGEHGAIAHIPVNITNVVNGPIQAIGFDVLYDHSILKLDYDNDDVLLNGDLTAANNWISILGTNVLLNFTVIGTAGETTPLELSDIGFSDPSGYNIGSAPAINGTFTVAGEAEPQEPLPFLIYGYVWYDGSTPCNNPAVSITNLDTGEGWTAGTGGGNNYYQITLTSGIDLNAGEMLRFNATDGTSTNLTDHTITADDVNNGGLFGFNLTLESTGDPAPHLVTYTISNTTTSPNGDGIMDDTEIDVKFSEPVDATILIENVTGVVKSIYTSSSKVTDPTPKTWDGTDDIGTYIM